MTEFEADKSYHQTILDRAFVSTGNNYRIKKVFEKAKNGEIITVAYIGGSITDDKLHWMKGMCYTQISYQLFKEEYGKDDNIRYVNAGMNGTSSMIGLIRAERDVLQYHPDIVFIEYAVNDTKDELHREGYESLILRLLRSKEQPAVVLIFTIAETGYTCQGHMQVIGEYYNLPMISVGDAINPEIAAGRMKWSDYSDDYIHPNQNGHRLIAQFIENYFNKVTEQASDTDYIIPEVPFYGNAYVNMRMLDSGNIKLEVTGSFQPEVTINEFKNGWSYIKNTSNRGLSFRLVCKNLFVIFMESNDSDTGDAEICLDGERKSVLPGYRILAWDNPAIRMVMNDKTAKEHIIEIKMLPGDEEKKFSLLAFGYSD